MPPWLHFGFLAMAVSIFCTALGIQLVNFILWADQRHFGIAYGVWNYLSYFTNLSNLLAATALLFALKTHSNPEPLRQRASPITGIAVLLVMTSVVYNLMLRQQYHPHGLGLVADVLLHDLCPALFLLFWWMYVPHSHLRFKDAMKWLLFPIGYFGYALIRGYFLKHYPYPFLDAGKYGYLAIAINGVEILAGFFGLGLLFVFADRKLKRRPA